MMNSQQDYISNERVEDNDWFNGPNARWEPYSSGLYIESSDYSSGSTLFDSNDSYDSLFRNNPFSNTTLERPFDCYDTGFYGGLDQPFFATRHADYFQHDVPLFQESPRIFYPRHDGTLFRVNKEEPFQIPSFCPPIAPVPPREGSRIIYEPVYEEDPEGKFRISLSALRSGIEKRKTVMLRNIPNSYTQKQLLVVLKSIIPVSFNFVYMPIDLKTKYNLGFGYVSVMDTESLIMLYNAMNMHCWPSTNSKKVCEVVFARIQVRTGYEDAGKGHYDMRKICREWNVMALPPQYRPLFFKRETRYIHGKQYCILRRVGC